MTNWITAWKHETARQAAQRAAAADRKAAAIEAGKAAVGTYTAVAELLGISGAAISDARRNAADRTAREPLADWLEIDLPNAGDAVPTVAEWEALPETERAAAASRAADAWRMIALTTGHLGRQLNAAAEAVSETLTMGDWDTEPELRDLAASALPGWDHRPQTEAEHHHLAALLADLSRGLMEQARTAHRQVDRWASRAGDEWIGIAGAD